MYMPCEGEIPAKNYQNYCKTVTFRNGYSSSPQTAKYTIGFGEVKIQTKGLSQ